MTPEEKIYAELEATVDEYMGFVEKGIPVKSVLTTAMKEAVSMGMRLQRELAVKGE
ncbi:MAG: hypothetical protein V3R78_10005 [Thermodesulfobacteriota bacterium]